MAIFKKYDVKQFNDRDYGFYGLTVDDDGLSIRLIDEDDKQIEVSFSPHPIGYRNFDEGIHLKDNFWSKKYFEDFPTKHTFFYSYQSDFLDWFHKQSTNIYEDEKLVHYIIRTENDTFEIIDKANRTFKVEEVS